MDADSWLWIALVAFLIFCCVPMLLMGRHDKRSHHKERDENVVQPSGSLDSTTKHE